MSSDRHDKSRAYPLHLNAIPILGGIVEPFVGIFATLLRIFRPARRVPERADTPRRRRRGLTLVLGGIEGLSSYNLSMAMGILESGYRGSVVRVPWNGCVPLLGSLRNLTDVKHHQQQAQVVAETIIDYKRSHPEGPVDLLAQSGGCWIVVRALEMLPPDIRVRSAVLLCPSISPGYDTRLAASKCEGFLGSIGGPGDLFFLGLGTLLLGTSDRVWTPSAGWVGWHHHPPGFVEIRWHPNWMRLGYFGNHITTSARGFIREVVSRMLRQESSPSS